MAGWDKVLQSGTLPNLIILRWGIKFFVTEPSVPRAFDPLARPINVVELAANQIRVT